MCLQLLQVSVWYFPGETFNFLSSTKDWCLFANIFFHLKLLKAL